MPFPMDHIVIYAADVGTSGRFYERLLGLLGFEKRRNHVFGRDGLFFDIRAAKHEGGYERGQPGVDHIGFRAVTRAEVDEIGDHMRVAGFEGRLIDFDSGDYALFLPDPDGVRIEITCYSDPDKDPVD